MRIHGIANRRERDDLVRQTMALVGLRGQYARRYPHEFSGGQRQRIGIARALVLHPKFVVCDEPVSALDVSIQSQVLNLLIELREQLGLTYLFIAHNLAVVKYISDRIGVMYLGKMVEVARVPSVYDNPLHPYTQALVSAIPRAGPDQAPPAHHPERRRAQPRQPAVGLPLPHPLSTSTSATSARTWSPRLEEKAPGHFVACHLY